MSTFRLVHVLLTLLIISAANLAWAGIGNMYLLFVVIFSIGLSGATTDPLQRVGSFACIYMFASFMLVNVLCILLYLAQRPWRAK